MAIRLALVGASGRTGSLIAESLSEYSEFSLAAALVSEQSRWLGKDLPGAPIRFTSDLEAGIRAADLVVDFSTPSTTQAVLEIAARLGKPTLIGTTGLGQPHQGLVSAVASVAPILVAPNTSVGIGALIQLALTAKSTLGPTFDIEILEAHHRHKRDAPSGTALAIADAIRSEDDLEIQLGRVGGQAYRRDCEVGIASLRGGDVVGDHTVFFLGAGERIEITHRVTDRRIFARGALRLAGILYRCPPGRYSVADMLRMPKS